MVIFGFEVFFELSWIEENGEVVSVTIKIFSLEYVYRKRRPVNSGQFFKWKFPECVKAEEILSLS